MILDTIRKRRSVFPPQFNDKEIPKELLRQLLDAANHAPTHRRTEPWRFKVLTGESKARLGAFMSAKYQEIEEKPKQIKIKKLEENPVKAAAILLICMQRDPQLRIPEWEEIAATAMAVQNIWLSATDLGIGGYWSSPSLIRYMDEFVDLNEGEKCLGLFYLGYSDYPLTEAQRTPIEEKVEWLD